jgi:lysophospholipase L1-like esterase
MIIKIYIAFFVIWLILSIAAYRYKKTRFGKFLSRLVYILFILGCIELASVVGFFLTSGKWLFREPYNYNADMFEPHPYMVGVPKKNVQIANYGIVYTHNSSGFRGEEFKLKSNKKRIIAIGGSTTYGVGVGDRQTWPFYLDSLLKDKFEVLNCGMPGHSTVENIIFASFYLSDYSPDIVIIQAGLNDLQSLNVPDLSPGYSDFHAPTLFGTLGFCYQNQLPKSGIVMLGDLLFEKLGWFPVCNYHKMEADYKGKIGKPIKREKALYLYRRNLKTLVSVCKQFNVKIIFVPQILVKESSEKNRLKWWIPYSDNESLEEDLVMYNNVMQQVADSSNCIYANKVIEENWVWADFVDPSHFNPGANSRLAKIISQTVLNLNE